MSIGSPSETVSSDNQICDAYVAADFVVTSGLNAGDGITNAADSFEGDTYVLAAAATPLDLVVREASFGAGYTPLHIINNAESSNPDNVTALKRNLKLESRLTLVGADGSNVDILTITNRANAAEPGEYFLPLSPMTPEIEYTLVNANKDPGTFSYADYACDCFARGTMIMLVDGQEKAVEDLEEGDLVATRDNGAQPVRWVGGRTATAQGHLAPIVVSNGALGNHADLIVSPQHRMLLSDWRAEVMLGSHEVLVTAKDLVNGETIFRRTGGVVEYFHILFDTHEIVYAEGVPSESLQINKTTLDGFTEESRAEIIELFPEIATNPRVSAVASRMSLKSFEASALLKQVGFR